MLKKIKASELKEGQRYSAPLFFDDGQNMLLLKGQPVTEYEIDMLKHWKIQYVLTAGGVIPEKSDSDDDDVGMLMDADEDLEELDDDDDPLTKNAQEKFAISGTHLTVKEIQEVSIENILKFSKDSKASEMYSKYLELVMSLDDLFGKIKSKQSCESMPVNNHAEILYNMVKEDPATLVNFILGTTFNNNNMARLSVNTAILAAILCEELELPKERTEDIIISALLHDVGMMRVPDKVVNKTGSLTAGERQMIEAHTVYGYKIALNEFMYTNDIAASVMQHHERWDGKGYPNNLSDNDIDFGARIIAVADAFIAMITPKPYRDLMLGYQAMKNLLADNARRFDPAIIKAMIRSIGIYPIGSMVLMNNASLARVIKSSPETPMRPFIRILIDEKGHIMEQNSSLIDLKENKQLFIVRPIDPRAYKTQ